MNKHKYKKHFYFVFALLMVSSFRLWAQEAAEPKAGANTDELPDSTLKKDFRVKQVTDDVFNDVQTSKFDLKDPENVEEVIEYDPVTGKYVVRKKVGEIELGVPAQLSFDQYKNYDMQQSLNRYWAEKNGGDRTKKKGPLDLSFDLGPAGAIFGEGGVQIKPQGYAELSFGVKTNRIDNYTLPERLRKTTVFDFDQKVQMNINGSVGDKIKLGMNYNTEATFDFDNKINLNYAGKEDDIIKKIEAGNVSLPLGGSLIQGSQSLFGFKTEMQFGKLRVAAVFSQQESESQTMNIQGGAATTDYEIRVDEYDANRNFFLSHFFEQHYDEWMKTMPVVSSKLKIRRVEVWVTNKRGAFEEARHIIPFVDLGETRQSDLQKDHWKINANVDYPSNDGNTLYGEITGLPDIRNISMVSQVMKQNYVDKGIPVFVGEDYEKVESARRLNPSEYYVNTELGYISLKNSLNNDEIVAVAFQYDYNGETFQVGEFSTHLPTPQTLVTKLLKGTSLTPSLKTWDLMMKNIYSLNAFQVDKEDFRLNIFYLDDKTGTELNYVPAGEISEKLLIRVMGLDRLNSLNEPYPDGFFDWVEGYTIIPSQGKIIFPTTKPFHMDVLGDSIGDPTIADNYVFSELYDSTRVIAQQFTEKNKYQLGGFYKSASGSEIKLNAFNIPRGSVRVTAGGRELVENVDYTVDYNSGYLKIINTGLLESGSNVQVKLENQATFNMQKKTMLGTHMDYQFSDDVNLGATLMHLYERPLTQKVNFGNDPISNTVWGLNGAIKKDLPFLTRWVDALPFIETKAPSRLSFKGEIAQLIPGHSKAIGGNGSAYIDDFEATKIGLDIRPWHYWKLASTPREIPDYNEINSLEHGKSRAKIAWYRIDRMFQEPNSQTPTHIRDDVEMRSNHYTRSVNERNLFPNKDNEYGEPTLLPVLNVSYYPTERGPYNVDVDNVDPNTGKFTDPENRWGGIMQRIDGSDFENSNVEYIEFWVMDPFIYNEDPNYKGGDLIFNLGNISEDVLRDGRKAFEHGMPITDDLENDESVEANAWGYVPLRQSMVVAFENDEASRVYQDVGIDGINSAKEQSWPGYQEYVNFLNSITPTDENDRRYVEHLKADIAQDDYQYFRGSKLDAEQADIFERYKNYNNLEGNSPTESMSGETYATAATKLPDIEDLNQDNTLNENESYFEYRIKLDPNQMTVGQNRIVDTKTERVVLANGSEEEVNWYQFKVPIREYDNIRGEIRDFRSIRFLRMYLTGFKQDTHLRFATFQLIRGEWRVVTNQLIDPSDQINMLPSESFETEAVNIEENADRKPVNYVLPPDVDRVIDPGQPQLRQLNEQAMVLRVKELEPGNAQAAYKNLNMDFRQFQRLQMWVHAEKLLDQTPGGTSINTELENGDLTLFVRIGSDFTNNYYEYNVPLQLTPEGFYDNGSPTDRQVVWPIENKLDFPIQELINLKMERNRLNRDPETGEINYTEYYDKLYGIKGHRIAVKGNPSVSRVESIMIGVRNSTSAPNEFKRSGEVWVNELRLTNFNEDGGWAGLANLSVQLADLGQVNVAGRMSTTGWGGIEQKLMERQLEDASNVDVSTNVQLGKFFPEKANINIPVYYSYSQDVVNPKYNPLDEDVLLKDAIANEVDPQKKQQIKESAQQFVERKSFNLTNVKVGISGEKKQFFDPNNFSMNFAYNEMNRRDPNTEKEITKQYRGGIGYNYSPTVKPLTPFNSVKAFQGSALQLVRDFNFSYFPQTLSVRSDMNRNYNQMQLKDLSSNGLDIPVAVRRDWFWNSAMDINYNPANSISLTFSAKTNTIVDEPTKDALGNEIILDKNLYSDQYSFWRDSVMRSISNFGRVTAYSQVFNARYEVPLSKIPILNWVTMDLGYGANYNFERGPRPFTLEDSLGNKTQHDLRHVIRNTQNKTLNGSMNFLGLFNKSDYLRDVNRKYGRARSGSSSTIRYKTAKYEKKNIDFKKGEKYTINHKLKSKKVTIRVYDENDRPISGDRKEINETTAEFTPRTDKKNGRVVVTARVQDKDTKGQVVMGKTLRFLMMPRNFSVNYSENNGFMLPGFREVGHLGQAAGAPGLDFAFGSQNMNLINRANENGWLTTSDQLNDRYMLSKAQNFTTRLSLEPFNSFKVDINASWVKSNTESAFYKYDATAVPGEYDFRPKVNYNQTGNFTMTWMAIGVSWGINKATYESVPFNEFMGNRETIARRLATKRKGDVNDYEPGNSRYAGYDLSSSEVLIPAFLAAYGGGDADHISLNPFPNMSKIKPNWRISYNGLSKLEFFKKYFRSITLNHAYQSTYSVGSYVTNNEFYDFILKPEPPANIGYFLPEHDITTVTITEAFSPFINVDMAWKNSLTSKLEFKRMRTLNLNITSNQLVEMLNNEFVVGMGYRWDSFNMIINSGSKSKSVNNDLTLRADVSWRDIKNLIREMDKQAVDENNEPIFDQDGNGVFKQGITQPTSGQNVFSLKFSADYVLSRSVNIRLFYDRMLNKPLISSSFTTGTSNFGVAFRFTLAN